MYLPPGIYSHISNQLLACICCSRRRQLYDGRWSSTFLQARLRVGCTVWRATDLQAMTETTGHMSSVKNLPDLIFTTVLNKYALPSRQWKNWKPAEAVSLEGHFCWKVRTKLKVCAPPSKRPLQRLQGAPYKTCSYTPFLLDAMWKFDPFSPDASQRVMQLRGTYSRGLLQQRFPWNGYLSDTFERIHGPLNK